MKLNQAVKTLAQVVLLTTTSWGFLAHAETIRIGTEGAYPPFNYVDADGNLAGFDIEIGDALCAQMEADCEWVVQDWDGLIPALLAKKFDTILASMSITDERKQKIDFTNKYYTTPVKCVQLKGSNHEISEAGLDGKVVGVQGGVVTENFVRGTFTQADVKAYGTQDEANLDLLSGRSDVVCADSFVMLDFVSSEAGQAAEFVGPEFNDKTYLGEGIGIGLRQGDEALKEKINAAITAIRADGTYEKINAKYFSFDVFGE